jgi:ribose transport system substrate-binding protein
MAKLLNNKGNVILLRYAVGSASTEEREKGFSGRHGKISRHQIDLLRSIRRRDRRDRYQASQNLLNRFGNEVNGVFCVAEPATIAMTKALRDIGKAGGKVKMVGFDAGSKSVLDMKNGDVQGLAVQNPVLMGYLAS